MIYTICSFFISTWISMAGMPLKTTEIKLVLLTDITILLMTEKRTRGGICHAIHRYVEPNNKYMKSYNKSKESSYLMLLDENNLYGWTMSQKLL